MNGDSRGIGFEVQKQGDGFEVDDDGQPKRTGTVWTASAHIITTVIGTGVLSLAWCVAQLGWIAGPVALLFFAFVTYYTACLLADCYRSPDPIFGKRNLTYMDAAKANLGGVRYIFCGVAQYVLILGGAVSFNITSALSMMAIKKSNCYHKHGHSASCVVSNNFYMILFGIAQIILSQIPNIHKLWGLSTVSAIVSFCYSAIGVGLSLAKIISGKNGPTTLGGVEIGPSLSESQKVWNMFNALGDIAFAYAFALVLIEIQDTLRAPAENKQMKKATLIGVSMTSLFYMLCGCVGYAAFGTNAPGNMLTGFGFYEPFWLIDFANVGIVVHVAGAYQVMSQVVFAAVETWAAQRWHKSKFITKEYTMYKHTLFKLVWRTCYVVVLTMLAMVMPFFNAVVGLLGALCYWPTSVYFPIEMHISSKQIKRFSSRWLVLQLINIICLLVALVAACGSVQGIIKAFKDIKPLHS